MNGRESKGTSHKKNPRNKARSVSPNLSRGASPTRPKTPSGKSSLDPNDLFEGNSGSDDSFLPGEDALDNHLESLGLKHTEVREEALESIVWYLRHSHPQAYLEEKPEFIQTIIKSIKNTTASTAERIGAMEALQLCFLHLEDHTREALYNSLSSYMDTMQRDYALDSDVRETCIFTVAFGCMLGCNDREKICELMEALLETAESEQESSTKLCTAALDAWGLLLTCVSDETAEALFYEKLTDFEEFLFSRNIELRISAAEVFALWLEEARESDEEFDTNSQEELDEIYRKLDGLAQEYETKSNSRSDRVKQRSTIKEVLAYIKDPDETPLAIVRLPHDEVRMDTWAEKREMDTIKQVVGSGLQYQMQVNVCLRSIFGLTGSINLSKDEQKQLAAEAQRDRKAKYESSLHKKSPYVKGRDKQRGSDRKAKYEDTGDYGDL